MTGPEKSLLVMEALFELVRFDLIHAIRGFAGVQRLLGRPVKARTPIAESVAAVCDAVVLATCYYWKPVWCLQRSVCVAHMLHARGVAARLVIGYRPTPFFSHAWVEVDGRVVNDSSVYAKRLHVLHTM